MADARKYAEQGLTPAVMQALSAIFDQEWYLARYPDVGAAGIDPLRHYVTHGITEGRNPNRWFDSEWYVEHYPDVAASGLNPLLHYLRCGAGELRNPHPRFDAAYYVDQHPDAATNPLLHHLRHGARLGWLTEKPIQIADYLPSAAAPVKLPRKVKVDVVIPAYRGLGQTRRCIESVLADPDRPPGRVVVVDDQSPEPALSAWLDGEARAGRIVLVRNKKNLGFVGAVNRGMAAAAPHDVALLNSDTEVPAGWLRRLAAQAYADTRIATVSPFSNNATICGYPSDTGGPMPYGMSLSAMDDICRDANAGRRVIVPTTVGFCMYIRRDALNDVGPFDEKAFGRGYGEENDFCMRASELGWRHVLACDTFVYHEGSVSFGGEANSLTAKGMDQLVARYPKYLTTIARHIRLDSVGPFRFAVTVEMFRRSGLPTILMVCHALGGGVRRHIGALVNRLAGRVNVLLLEATTRGAALSAPALLDHPVLSLPADRLEDLVQVLHASAVNRVHLHHLAGMDVDIRALIRRLDAPFDVTVHDYFAICPQVNLLPSAEGQYCHEPGPATCNACISARPSHGAREILSWRREQAWQFHEADRVLCPSTDVRDRLARYGLADKAIVAPHEPVPAEPWPIAPPAYRSGRLRVAVLGVLANHKGAHVVASVADIAEEAGLEIRLIGYTEDDFPVSSKAALQETGEYRDSELPGLIQKLRPHVIWFPAPWPETYSYTLSTAIESGLPIVASRIGSFPERLQGRPLTWLVSPTVSETAWLDAFERVRTALRSRPSVTPAAERKAIPDFYPDGYLAPVTRPKQSTRVASSPAARRDGAQGGPLIDLRRDGRISVVVVPERFDSRHISPCAYIRLLQPLDHPAICGEMDIVLADADGACRYHADIIATQRYAMPDVAAADALAAHARRTGAALLYDLDDDLLNIPRDHADAQELRPKAKIVQRMVRAATQVWVSTSGLAARLTALCDDPVIVANGLDERLWAARPVVPRPWQDPARILCMGTATHDADFALILPALSRLKDDFGHRVVIDMLGFTARTDVPAWINRLGMPQTASQSYPGFVNWLVHQQGWDIGLAPLVDTPFNLCKSSIKTLDYAARGMAVLASDLPVYRGSIADGPGGRLVPNDPAAWYAALSALVRDTEKRQRLGQEALAAFLASGTLASQAEARVRAWKALMKRPRRSATGAEKGRERVVLA